MPQVKQSGQPIASTHLYSSRILNYIQIKLKSTPYHRTFNHCLKRSSSSLHSSYVYSIARKPKRKHSTKSTAKQNKTKQKRAKKTYSVVNDFKPEKASCATRDILLLDKSIRRSLLKLENAFGSNSVMKFCSKRLKMR